MLFRSVQRAVGLCRDGLRRFPDHVSARVTLGLALVDLGEFDQAREHLQVALRRAPDNLAAIRGLAHLHDHHHVETEEPLPEPELEVAPEPEPVLTSEPPGVPEYDAALPLTRDPRVALLT